MMFCVHSTGAANWGTIGFIMAGRMGGCFGFGKSTAFQHQSRRADAGKGERAGRESTSFKVARSVRPLVQNLASSWLRSCPLLFGPCGSSGVTLVNASLVSYSRTEVRLGTERIAPSLRNTQVCLVFSYAR